MEVCSRIKRAVWIFSVRIGGDEYVQELERRGGVGIGAIAWMYDADEYDAGGGG